MATLQQQKNQQYFRTQLSLKKHKSTFVTNMQFIQTH